MLLWSALFEGGRGSADCGLFLVNDPRTPPTSKRANHNINWAYVSKHFETEKKYIKKIFLLKNDGIFFQKSWKNMTKNLFSVQIRQFKEKKILLWRKKNILMEKILEIFFVYFF